MKEEQRGIKNNRIGDIKCAPPPHPRQKVLPWGKTQQASIVDSQHSHKTLSWINSQENERMEERESILLRMSTGIQCPARADFIEKCDLSLNKSPRLAHDSSAPPQGKVTWRLQV